MELEQEAAAVGLERAVESAGRAAGECGGGEFFAAFAVFVVADDQIALEQVHLFPMIVDEGRGCIFAGNKAQDARAAAAFAVLVQIGHQDFLGDAVRIAFQRFKAAVHIERKKFKMRKIRE